MSDVPEAARGAEIATWSQTGLGTYRLYEDGTIELERWTAAGHEVCTESVRGAAARVEESGARMLLRDTRQAFLTIEGPYVAISVRIDNYYNVAASVQRFAADVNELAQRLGPPPSAGAHAPSVTDQLGELAQLRESGVLTDAEFEAMKAQLLERM